MASPAAIETPATISDWIDAGVSISKHQWRRRKFWRDTLSQSPELQAKLEETHDQYLINCVKRLYTHPYFSFEPRPDDPANGDQQTSFLESQAFTTVLIGGNGCLGAEQTIYDPVAGCDIEIGQQTAPFHVWTRSADGAVSIGLANRPFIKGTADLYRIRLSNGADIIATLEHRMLTPHGWRSIVEIGIGGAVVCEYCNGCIESMEFVRTDLFYDISVWPHANYWCAGTWHHNSGKTYCGAQKAIKFLCEDQPPPIKDTPFFVIADNLLEAARSCWAQKLFELIPSEWVDQDRISFQDTKLNFPKIVCLRPWPDNPDTNWTLYFCGYTQERAAFQSVAAGGAWFTEQFPYEIYEEVAARMRQWMYPGSIWMEFTPIDPARSQKIQEQYEAWTRGQLDESVWSFHRLNTESAAKQGHVKEDFVATLKATVSPEMLATRLRGDFGSYEGVIYQSFNPLVHFIPGTQFSRVPNDINLTYKRAIDWGAGPSNAFVVLWGVKDTMGRWFIFDEYYTTDQLKTWEDHVREIHKKDGWKLVCEVVKGQPRYRLEKIEGMPQRWLYDRSNFGQTYAPPEQPDLFREFAKYCLPVTPAKNAYHPGIDCVRMHLKFNDVTREQLTEPRLFIDREACPNLAKELPALQWQVPPKHGVNPRDAKMEQKKINDHSPDALRYLLYSDWQGGAGTLSAFKVEPPTRPQVRFKR